MAGYKLTQLAGYDVAQAGSKQPLSPYTCAETLLPMSNSRLPPVSDRHPGTAAVELDLGAGRQRGRGDDIGDSPRLICVYTNDSPTSTTCDGSAVSSTWGSCAPTPGNHVVRRLHIPGHLVRAACVRLGEQGR